MEISTSDNPSFRFVYLRESSLVLRARGADSATVNPKGERSVVRLVE
jgi:hypothetical protein